MTRAEDWGIRGTDDYAEVPGSVWFGDADGIGWIFGPASDNPLLLQLHGQGADYTVDVGRDRDGQALSMTMSGFSSQRVRPRQSRLLGPPTAPICP